jgi:hypothetical protein
LSFTNNLHHSAFVRLRPFAFRAARVEFAGVFLIVDLLDEAVDPAEAQGFLHGGFIIDIGPAARRLEIHQPDFLLAVVVLHQPGTPVRAVSGGE